MDLDQLDTNPESLTFSSASYYEVALAVFHYSHGLPTAMSADKQYAEEEGRDKANRKAVAARINIWK